MIQRRIVERSAKIFKLHILADLRSTRLSNCQPITCKTFKLSSNHKQGSSRVVAFYPSYTISDNLNWARNDTKRKVTGKSPAHLTLLHLTLTNTKRRKTKQITPFNQNKSLVPRIKGFVSYYSMNFKGVKRITMSIKVGLSRKNYEGETALGMVRAYNVQLKKHER